jgi:hypothetical protein
VQEPAFDGEKVVLPPCTQEAHDAYAASGMLSAAQDYDVGGMQLPYTVEAAANAFFACASLGEKLSNRLLKEEAKEVYTFLRGIFCNKTLYELRELLNSSEVTNPAFLHKKIYDERNNENK